MPKTTTNIQGQPTNSDRSRKRIFKTKPIDETGKKWVKDITAPGNLHRLVTIKPQ